MSDVTIFSPRASFMAHHIGDRETSAAMLPQSPGVDPRTCLPKLE